jgi:hypothetical protein
MPEEAPPTFSIARPARLLGIAWSVSVPAVLWSHVKFSNPIAAVTVAGGVLVGVGLALALAWVAFYAFRRSRNAAAVAFGGLACVGLGVNVLVGVFMTLASGALREIDRGPGTVQAQIRQELSHVKQAAKEEIAKAQDEGVKGLLKEQAVAEIAPIAPDLVLGPPGEQEQKPAAQPAASAVAVKQSEPTPSAAPAHEVAANAHADVSPAPKPESAKAAASPKPAKPAATVANTAKTHSTAQPKPQVNVPQRGISVRKPGSNLPEPVVATIDDATVDRLAYDAAKAIQDKLDRAARRYADSALRLSTMRDPLLFHSQVEFREFRRALDQHRADAEALREGVVTAGYQMQTRLSQAGVPTPQTIRHVSMAFPVDITEASAGFHDAYLEWLNARERRAMVLETSLGRWKYNSDSKQLWLADDGVRSACESAFDGVRASSSMLAVKRGQAEELGIPTRASELREQASRVAGEGE